MNRPPSAFSTKSEKNVMRYKTTISEPYFIVLEIPLLAGWRRCQRKKASMLRQLIDTAQYCISRYAKSSCPLGSADKTLESWINRESMTQGRVVAPRRMPDEAPGLEHKYIIILLLSCVRLQKYAKEHTDNKKTNCTFWLAMVQANQYNSNLKHYWRNMIPAYKRCEPTILMQQAP